MFWLGALMRPVGAIVLGAYIDQIGRRKGLIVTLAIMAAGTVTIAVCPTYASIGVAAPAIVLIGRLLQGFSAGVELGGVSVYLSEISTPGNKGFYTSFQSSSQQVAIFVAALIGYFLSEAMPPAVVADWGWRIPFFIGCMIIPFIFFLRRTLEETPEFLAMKKHPTASEVFASALANWRIVVLGMMLAVMTTVTFYFVTVYTPTFGKNVLKLSTQDSLLVTLMVAFTNFFWNPVGGAVSDRIGRKPVLLTIAALSLVTAYPMLSWLVADAEFQQDAARRTGIFILFRRLQRHHAGRLGRGGAAARPHHLLLAGLRARRRAVRHLHAVRRDLADRPYRQPGIASILADVRGGQRRYRDACNLPRRQDHRDTRGRCRLTAMPGGVTTPAGIAGFAFHANQLTRRMVDLSRKFDVLVIGGGNAALCAAISARRAGASVLVLEGAPKFYRGGNTRHTRNMRCAHDAATDILTGPYPEAEFWEDLQRVTGGQTDEELARFMIAESKDILGWVVEQGVRWQPSLGGTLSLGRTNSFFLGGGRAMLNALYLTAERLGVDILYDAEVLDLEIDDGMFLSASLKQGDGRVSVRASTLVAAAGGFEANIEWLKEYWGDAADNFLIRGTPYNRGSILKMLLANGVQDVGDPTQCHAVAIDARAPKFDGGIITRHDSVVFGIVVNKHAQRFYDEGEDIWPKRYAIWGRLVAAQPDQIAYIVFDSTVLNSFMPTLFPPIKAGWIAELAGKFELDPAALEKTVADFNAAVRPGTFDHTILDDCRTEGLTPPKTHWARKIETPPFYAYPVRPGITFTYLGTRVNKQARMLMKDGKQAANMFAAGEIMAGNVLGKGYAAGIGMTIGSVFGRVAGREAARNARN